MSSSLFASSSTTCVGGSAHVTDKIKVEEESPLWALIQQINKAHSTTCRPPSGTVSDLTVFLAVLPGCLLAEASSIRAGCSPVFDTLRAFAFDYCFVPSAMSALVRSAVTAPPRIWRVSVL